MTNNFFKFPSTPHLAILGDVDVRADKVMSEAERNAFLSNELVVEEKVDGANLGISFNREGNIRIQNRGAYLELPVTGQWKKLHEWLTLRTETFFEHLIDRYILFGEWCYARHSVYYDHLPDWFLGFDIYDKRAARFFSSSRRDKLLRSMDIWPVPRIGHGQFTLTELKDMISKSQCGNSPAEGLYFRHDKGGWLVQRAKLVRPDFIQSIARHWSHGEIRPNLLGAWSV